MSIKAIFVWNLVLFISAAIAIKIILCTSYLHRKAVTFVKISLDSVDYIVCSNDDPWM